MTDDEGAAKCGVRTPYRVRGGSRKPASMSNSESLMVKQLRAAIEEDRRIIRGLRQEIDRLRYLLGLHSLQKAEAQAPPVIGTASRKLRADLSN